METSGERTMKLTVRPKCIDCGHEAVVDGDGGEVWTITKEGDWLCEACYQDSWDNDLRVPDIPDKVLNLFEPEIIKDEDPVDEYAKKYNLF